MKEREAIILKIKHVTRMLCVFSLIVSILLCGGVFATWTFANPVIEKVSGQWEIMLGKIDWTGSDVLPDDGSTGEKHAALIQKILDGVMVDENGKVTNLGLNSSDSYISKEIKDRSGSWFAGSDTLGSMDFWEKNDINNYFNTNTENVSFILYFPNGVADTYYLYTTSVKLEDNGNPTVAIGQNIYPIYETVLKKNSMGIYEATKTTLGYAKSAYYDNRITGSLLKYPSFDPSTFTAAELGHTSSTAIWTYKGQDSTVYPKSATADIYLRVKPSADTSYTVTVSMGCKVTVLDQNLNPVAVTGGSQGSASVTFNATANRTYYFKISGAEAIGFELS